MRQRGALEVYSADDLARAMGVSRARVGVMFGAGGVRTVDEAGRFVSFDEAVRVMRAVKLGAPLDPALGPQFLRVDGVRRARVLPIAVSGSIHGVLLVALVILGMVGVESKAAPPVVEEVSAGRMVFLTTLGPGGGGGGGGRLERTRAARAERQGERHLSSPLPAREPAPEPTVRETTPKPMPPIQAPVATMAADAQDRVGVTEDVPEAPVDSHGPGANGGAGTGAGTGLGQGQGAGIGPGEGGGAGGGPYRAGSGITPPRLLREVKPDYSEDARRRGLEGEVVMEIVVRQNGSVGDVTVLRGLGYGLDQRAIAAIRQWRFAPAHRYGQPVDVIVEASVEFRLR